MVANFDNSSDPLMTNDTPELTNSTQTLLAQLSMEFIREKKRARRWRIVKLAIFLALIGFIFYLFSESSGEQKPAKSLPHVGLIDIKGNMFEDEDASSDNIVKSLDKAYSSKGLKALILRIDSPGGSPVQADYIYTALRYYREKYPDVKTYAVCVDMCASAAYYVAAAADEIYANPSSLVGSIGVLYNGFGFVDSMHKLGITRRLQTAGRNKGFMDQFSPVDASQEKLLQTMLDLIHQEFIDRVKTGRGKRLIIDNDTFSGLFWTGRQAKQRGLIDGFSSSGQLARNVIKIDRVVDYSNKESPFDKMAKRFGVMFAHELPLALGIRPGLQ